MKQQILADVASCLRYAESCVSASNKALALPNLPELPSTVTVRASAVSANLELTLGCNEQEDYDAAYLAINDWLNLTPARVIPSDHSIFVSWRTDDLVVYLHFWRGNNA